MAMYDSANKLKEEFKELFKDGMTPRQLWWVVKMMKAARFYCRNNVAFNNFMNSVFQGIAEFRQVPKKDVQGKEYSGLEIKIVRPDGAGAVEVMVDIEE